MVNILIANFDYGFIDLSSVEVPFLKKIMLLSELCQKGWVYP